MAPRTRPATFDDAAGIAAAHMRGWQVAYRGMVPDEFLDALVLEQRIELWQGLLQLDALPDGTPSPTDYVAEVDGHVVGFANVGVFRKEAGNALAGELWAMYVHPDHWGTGAGYALMKTTIDHFVRHRVQTSYLWVLDDNERARRFYERQGWSADDVTQTESLGGADLVERRYSLDLT